MELFNLKQTLTSDEYTHLLTTAINNNNLDFFKYLMSLTSPFYGYDLENVSIKSELINRPDMLAHLVEIYPPPQKDDGTLAKATENEESKEAWYRQLWNNELSFLISKAIDQGNIGDDFVRWYFEQTKDFIDLEHVLMYALTREPKLNGVDIVFKIAEELGIKVPPRGELDGVLYYYMEHIGIEDVNPDNTYVQMIRSLYQRGIEPDPEEWDDAFLEKLIPLLQ